MVGNLEVGLIEAEIPTGETVVARPIPRIIYAGIWGSEGFKLENSSL
jgi:hypothetical protein